MEVQQQQGFMTMAAKTITNEKGLATIESMALLVVFTVLIGYGIGYFGIVHTGILNSIAARSYAFETFDHRVDLTYFRSNRLNTNVEQEHYKNYGFRAHGVRTEKYGSANDALWEVTERSISIGRPSSGRIEGNHQLGEEIMGAERRGVNPVWIKTVYGICLNVACGGAGS